MSSYLHILFCKWLVFLVKGHGVDSSSCDQWLDGCRVHRAGRWRWSTVHILHHWMPSLVGWCVLLLLFAITKKLCAYAKKK